MGRNYEKGKMVVTFNDDTPALIIPYVEGKMAFPGWILLLTRGATDNHPTTQVWYQVPPNAKFVEFQESD